MLSPSAVSPSINPHPLPLLLWGCSPTHTPTPSPPWHSPSPGLRALAGPRAFPIIDAQRGHPHALFFYSTIFQQPCFALRLEPSHSAEGEGRVLISSCDTVLKNNVETGPRARVQYLKKKKGWERGGWLGGWFSCGRKVGRRPFLSPVALCMSSAQTSLPRLAVQTAWAQ